MPVIGPQIATMFNYRNPDAGAAWAAATPPEPTAEQRAQAEQNRIASKLLPAIFAEDFAAGRVPLGGHARMTPRTPNFTTSSLIPAAAGGYWVPAHRIEELSATLEIAEPMPDIGPADTLILHLNRAIADARLPAGYSRARHKTDPNASISGGAEGPIIKVGLNDWLIPHEMAESAHAAGFEINPRDLK
jgi:hypothetical protein